MVSSCPPISMIKPLCQASHSASAKPQFSYPSSQDQTGCIRIQVVIPSPLQEALFPLPISLSTIAYSLSVLNYFALPEAPIYHYHYGLNFSRTNIETHMPASPFFPILGTFQTVSPSFGFTPVCLIAFLVNLESFEKPKSLYNSLRNTEEYKQLSKSSVLILK